MDVAAEQENLLGATAFFSPILPCKAQVKQSHQLVLVVGPVVPEEVHAALHLLPTHVGLITEEWRLGAEDYGSQLWVRQELFEGGPLRVLQQVILRHL